LKNARDPVDKAGRKSALLFIVGGIGGQNGANIQWKGLAGGVKDVEPGRRNSSHMVDKQCITGARLHGPSRFYKEVK
jgi:hypothetical protein